MATEYTANYNLDKYTANDKPNLRDQYNAAMDKIDTQLLAANTNATEAKAAVQGVSAALPLSFFTPNSTVKDYIDNYVDNISESLDIINEGISKSNVLLYGGKTETYGINWSSVISQAIENGKGVYFPAGKYYIDSVVEISDPLFFVANGCKFFITTQNAHFDFISTLTKVYIIGASFVTENDTARNAISVVRYDAHTAINLIGCHFFGFSDTAFINRNLGIQITSCMFFNCNTACILGTDFTIANSGFYNCNHSIHLSNRRYDGTGNDNGGFSTVIGCQFYVNATTEPNAAFIYSQTSVDSLNLIGCDFDTTTRLLECTSMTCVIIDGCRFLWDNTFAGRSACLFYLRGNNYTSETDIIKSISITNCIFATPHFENDSSYEITGFGGDQNALNYGDILYGYKSENCLLHITGNNSIPNTTTHKWSIPLGYVRCYTTPKNNEAIHYKCAGNNVVSSSHSRIMAKSEFGGVELLHYTHTCKVYFKDSPNDVKETRYGMGTDITSDVVIGLDYRDINTVTIIGPIRNACYESDSTVPSIVTKLQIQTGVIS